MVFSKDSIEKCALEMENNGVCSLTKTINLLKENYKDKIIGLEQLSSFEALSKIISYSGKDEEELVKELKGYIPDGEHKSLLMRFKPLGPSDTLNLLSDLNIRKVMERFSLVFTRYYSMKFQMIDFDGCNAQHIDYNIDKESIKKQYDIDTNDIIVPIAIKKPETEYSSSKSCKADSYGPTELGKINLVSDVITKSNKAGETYNTFGVVLNTDVRTGGGIHWFTIFCDFRRGETTVDSNGRIHKNDSPNKDYFTLEYFNSSGFLPPPQVDKWLLRTCIKLNSIMENGKKKYPTKIVLNVGTQHQQLDTECGVYSIYYIYKRLKGVSYVTINSKEIPDELMTKFRKNLFSNEDNI
jgi:hypothetical protein